MHDALLRTKRINSQGRLHRFVSQAGLPPTSFELPMLPVTLRLTRLHSRRRKKLGQFQNRQGLRKAVLPRSVLSCSTFHASRTIEHRDRPGHGRTSFTMALLLSASQPKGWMHGLDVNLPPYWCKTRDLQSTQDNDGAVRKSPILQSVLILVRQSEQVSSRTRRGARQRETGSPHRLRAYGVQACSANPLTASQRGWARKRCTSRAPAANVTRNNGRDQRRATTFRHCQRHYRTSTQAPFWVNMLGDGEYRGHVTQRTNPCVNLVSVGLLWRQSADCRDGPSLHSVT